MERRYYEIEFAKSAELNDNELIDTPDRPTICIVGEDEPTIEEAAEFCKSDMGLYECDTVVAVREITKTEAYDAFDMENEDRYPVFRRAEYPMSDKEFTKASNALGGVWVGEDAYRSSVGELRFIDYRPAYPDKSDKDMTICYDIFSGKTIFTFAVEQEKKTKIFNSFSEFAAYINS